LTWLLEKGYMGMDTYFFSVFTSGMFEWGFIPQKQPYKVIQMTSSVLFLRGNKEGLLQLKITKPHDGLINSMSYFIENKSLHLYLVCPFTMRMDVFGCSSSYQRSLKENGTLFKEYDLIHFLSVWRDRVQYLPDSSLQCCDVITNSCDLVMRSDSSPFDTERSPLSTVGLLPEFYGFGMFDNEYSYASQVFTRLNPKKLTKWKANRTSLIYVQAGGSMGLCIPTLKDMGKKLDQRCPESFLEEGRRVNCILLLDEFAPSVDTRLLTPGNLDMLGVLVIKPSEYFAWISKSEEIYQTMESSIHLRESIFKSLQDFRFSPPAFMYHWKIFAFNTSTKMKGSLPQCDWTAIILNTSPMDYCKNSLSLSSMNRVRNTAMFRGGMRFEYFNYLERSLFKIPFQKKMRLTIHTCEVANNYEKTLEKSFKEKPEEHFLATLGYLKYSQPSEGLFASSNALLTDDQRTILNQIQEMSPTPSHPNKWSEKLFNLRIRKVGGFMYSEFIEDCFEGFALESAKEILSCSASECCICCSNKVCALLEGCGHSFCTVCLQTILENSSGSQSKSVEPCPTCRAPFSKDTMVQFKAYKTTRRKLREETCSLTRKRALSYLLKRKHANPESPGKHFFVDKSPMVMEEEEGSESQHSEELQKSISTDDTSTTLLIIPYESGIDKVKEWCPGMHCVSLQGLQILASSQKMSRIILISPYITLEFLETLHGILQLHTACEFTLEIISLQFSTYCPSEDFSWTSSLVEAYGPHEKSISALIL